MRFHRTAAAMLSLAAAAHAQDIAEHKSLTLEGARRIVAAIESEASRRHVGGAVAVVDEGGNPICIERRDGTFAAATTVSLGKARTAALFRKNTAFFEDVITKQGRTSMVALNDFTPLQGGVLISVDGQVVGAVGVSGASSAHEDEELAAFGAAAIGQPPSAGRAPDRATTRDMLGKAAAPRRITPPAVVPPVPAAPSHIPVPMPRP